MCTALNLVKKHHYFGRNLDLDFSYGEEVVVIPRNYNLEFRKMPNLSNHFAWIGMATVVDGVALFYDGANECGLCMAGLNFPNNACFYAVAEGKDNVAPFEFIPWILSQCATVEQAKTLLAKINLVNIAFADNLPLSPLHWIISDKKQSIVVETIADGMHVYDNPIGVLTNNPPFQYHLDNLQNYSHLTPTNGKNNDVALTHYCQGLGAVGLPGDLSSMSRFVRASFAKQNSLCYNGENSCVSQFFHLLGYVEMPRGVCIIPNGNSDVTIYTCCINADLGLYYYTTYDNSQICCVDMRRQNLDGNQISRFALKTKQQIYFHN